MNENYNKDYNKDLIEAYQRIKEFIQFLQVQIDNNKEKES